MNWLRQHFFALGDAFAQLKRAPGNAFFNILVLSLMLSLPFVGITLLENLQNITGHMAVEPEISVFIKNDVPRENAIALQKLLEPLVNSIASKNQIIFIPKEQALETLQRKDGITDVVKTLGKNPLPDTYLIRIAGNDGEANFAIAIEKIAGDIAQLPSVRKVQIDSDWIKRLAAFVKLVRLCIFFLGVTLGIVVIAVVFNTIRLQVITRTEEIAVMRLIGATRAYIRRPFYYMGILLGLFSGLIALGIALAALHPLNDIIGNLARLYSSDIQLVPPMLETIGLLLLGSCVLGWIGALFSVNRQLRKMN